MSGQPGEHAFHCDEPWCLGCECDPLCDDWPEEQYSRGYTEGETRALDLVEDVFLSPEFGYLVLKYFIDHLDSLPFEVVSGFTDLMSKRIDKLR